MRERGDRSLSMLERELAELRSEVDSMRQRLAAMPVRVAPPAALAAPQSWFLARIVGNTLHATNRWRYSFVEVELRLDGGQYKFQNKQGGVSGQFFNLYEMNNDGNPNTVLGIGLTVEELTDEDCPFELRPLPTSALIVPVWEVVATDGTRFYVGFAPNPIAPDEDG